MLTKDTFEKIYERYQSSGLSVRDFCSNEGLHEAKFYYWQKKIAKASIKKIFQKHKTVKGYLCMVRSVMQNRVFFHYDRGSRSQKVVVELLKRLPWRLANRWL